MMSQRTKTSRRKWKRHAEERATMRAHLDHTGSKVVVQNHSRSIHPRRYCRMARRCTRVPRSLYGQVGHPAGCGRFVQ